MPTRRHALALLAAGALQWTLVPAAPAQDAAERPATREGEVAVALLSYADGTGARCFASHFLDDVARRTQVNVKRDFQSVALSADNLHEFPFAVLTGEGAFTLSDGELQRLKTYLERGGFVLASAGCSNAQWASSFRDAVARMFPDARLDRLPGDHPIFSTLYQVDGLQMRKGGAHEGLTLAGGEQRGRLAVVFSPEGLNDTAHAGGGCCCCGGNEVRNAPQVNANILLYALTH